MPSGPMWQNQTAPLMKEHEALPGCAPNEVRKVTWDLAVPWVVTAVYGPQLLEALDLLLQGLTTGNSLYLTEAHLSEGTLEETSNLAGCLLLAVAAAEPTPTRRALGCKFKFRNDTRQLLAANSAAPRCVVWLPGLGLPSGACATHTWAQECQEMRLYQRGSGAGSAFLGFAVGLSINSSKDSPKAFDSVLAASS